MDHGNNNNNYSMKGTTIAAAAGHLCTTSSYGIYSVRSISLANPCTLRVRGCTYGIAAIGFLSSYRRNRSVRNNTLYMLRAYSYQL